MHKLFIKQDRTRLLIILGLCIIVSVCFLFLGLKPQSIAYFLKTRTIKLIAILVVSVCIGYSTMSFQTITNNHILTPSIMGLDSLYLFVQTLIVFFVGGKELLSMDKISNFLLSVIVMVGFSLILFVFLFKKTGANIYKVVFSGIILGGLFRGLSTFMQILLDPNEYLMLQGKMFASFNNIHTKLLLICLIISIVVIVLNFRNFKLLDVVALGKTHAINLGINYDRFMLKQFLYIAVLIAISTALVGPITFLGILVISLARRLCKTYKHTYLWLYTTLLSILFLVGAILFVERVFQFSTTISVIIDFVGGLYFVWLLIKGAKS